MASQEQRQVSPEQVQLMARIAGYEISPGRLERVAGQVTAVLQSIGQLDAKELQSVEPAFSFRLPWE